MHDALLFSLSEALHEGGVQHDVEPRFLFAAVAPPSFWRLAPTTSSQIIPDLAVRGPDGTPTPGNKELHDVKTICHSNTRYKEAWVTGRRDARGVPAAKPVDVRASHVSSEYISHARHFDRTHVGTSSSTTGPFEQRLAEFGQVQGLVFGHYGECSSSVRALVRRIAKEIALKTGLHEGARSIPEAIAAQTERLYRTLSITCHRERAQIVQANLMYVGNGSTANGVQRNLHHRQARFAARRAAYRDHTAGGPSVSPPFRGGGPFGG